VCVCVCLIVCDLEPSTVRKNIGINPFTDEAQTALFKDPVRTAL